MAIPPSSVSLLPAAQRQVLLLLSLINGMGLRTRPARSPPPQGWLQGLDVTALECTQSGVLGLGITQPYCRDLVMAAQHPAPSPGLGARPWRHSAS